MPLNPPLNHWQGRVAWLIGASSGIGRATASRLHALGAIVVVSARDAAALQGFVNEHPGSHALPFDASDRALMADAIQKVMALHGRLDLAMYCAGHYQAMRATQFNLEEMLKHQRINYTGALHMLDSVLPVLMAAGHGHISLVGSVAGYRGLPEALAYGPTKAALQNLAEALYFDLHPRGIGVSIVNPGFVATKLTATNRFSMPALLTPEQAAEHIVNGWTRGCFEIHFPKRFTLWLKFLRHLGHGPYFSLVRRFTGA
jgi:NAD(P)-dependent dehydrogenase (short-subunit alcohol dehydrogenase family)